ncbi:DUF3887 domain-containing protein [Evansella sp. AB-rgal1]|uniref:DUF3887 domain-containing protein n=1 Tax=Evansella sp. AB-rgal1 TaxID=3242696 RepID=UPI00359CC2CD
MSKYRIGLYSLMMVLFLAACNNGNDDGTNNAEESLNKEAKRVELAENFISLITEGDFEAATEHFDETMSDELPPEVLEELWESFQNQFGSFLEQKYLRTEATENYQVVFIQGLFEGTEAEFSITFDEELQIAGFFVY